MDNLRFIDLSTEFCNQVFDLEKMSIDEPWTLNQIEGLVDDKVICYYSFYNICDEGNINNLAVLDSFRGQGIGSMLLEDMIDVAKSRQISALTLEVNVNNKVAIYLYQKFGFVVEGKRVKFYGGRDDALIMWKRDI